MEMETIVIILNTTMLLVSAVVISIQSSLVMKEIKNDKQK